MRSTIESYLAWAGLITQAGSFATYCAGILSDPLYVLGAAIAGVSLSLWFAVASWTDMQPVESAVLVVGATAAPRQVFVRSQFERAMSLALATVAILVLLVTIAFERRPLFGLADVYAVDEIALGHMIPDPNEGEYEAGLAFSPYYDLTALNAYSANRVLVVAPGCRFSLVKRPSRHWIQIDSVRVIVERFQPYPRHMKPVFHAKPAARAYVVQLDSPATHSSDSFPARLLAVQGADDPSSSAVWDPGHVVLDDDLPQTCIIRVLARTSGVYTYRVEVDVSYRWQKQTMVIARGMRCACEGADSAWRDTGPANEPPLRDNDKAPAAPRAPEPTAVLPPPP